MIAEPAQPGKFDRCHRRRRGFGLIEMAVSAVLLAAAMVATAKVITWVALERRATERRDRAVVEAANLLERINARPWSELEPGPLAESKLPEAATRFLPGAILSVQVVPFPEPPVRKRITVELRWQDRSGRPEAPVRLVAWVFQAGRGKP